MVGSDAEQTLDYFQCSEATTVVSIKTIRDCISDILYCSGSTLKNALLRLPCAARGKKYVEFLHFAFERYGLLIGIHSTVAEAGKKMCT